MKLNDQVNFNSEPFVNSKVNYFSQERPYPIPVSEGNQIDSFLRWILFHRMIFR